MLGGGGVIREYRKWRGGGLRGLRGVGCVIKVYYYFMV